MEYNTNEDVNVFAAKEVEEAKPKLRDIPHQSDYPEKFFTQRNINGYVIESGNVADRPDGTTHTRAYFAEDENKLYIYNETSGSWVGITLS